MGAKLVGVVDPSAVPAWSADSSQIAALVSPTEIGFWNKDGTAGGKTGKHEKAITSLYWKPDGKILAVVASDAKRYFWKPDGTAEGTVDTKSEQPAFAWAKDGKGFFTPGKFWPRIALSFTEFGKGSHDNVVSPDQTSLIYWTPGEINLAKLENGDRKDIEWKVPQARGGYPTFSSDGKRLAVPDSTGIALYDARDPKKVVRLGGGAAVPPLNAAVFSPKGDRLAIGSQTGHVYLCEATGKILRVIPPPKKVDATVTDAICDMRWHPDGKHLVVSSGNITVTIYDTESGKAVAATSLQGVRALGMAIFSPENPDHLLIAQPDVSALWRWKLEKEPIQKFPASGNSSPARTASDC